MAEQHVYRTSIRWQQERRGSLSAPGLPELQVATPPEFPGGHGGIWSPEHMYVAAAESCVMTTFLAIAANSKLEFKTYASEAEGTLERVEGRYEFTHIVVRVKVTIPSSSSVDRARRIVEKAEENCLIAASMKTEVRVEPEVVVA
jgi:peroxiredoxin-like protein